MIGTSKVEDDPYRTVNFTHLEIEPNAHDGLGTEAIASPAQTAPAQAPVPDTYRTERILDATGPAARATASVTDLVELDPYATQATLSATQPVGFHPVFMGLPSVAGYEVQSELGRGGMGVVYKARQLKLNRLVALKMILSGAHADPAALDRFRAEAEAVAQLQHPNIVQIYEIGEHDGLPFFSLEFVEGGGLDNHVRATPQPPRHAAQLVATIAKAIHTAHLRSIIHRDLKPANVLLQLANPSKPAGGAGSIPDRQSTICDLQLAIPKISDFGLAKQLGSDTGRTEDGSVMGTPSFMAPEQAAGKVRELGPAADIYALGAILYDLLTGRPPFKGATAMETVMQVIELEPVPPARLQPGIPRDLETICLKCLEKEPSRRYTSAQALADDLESFLRDLPIQARAVSKLERGIKWARRRPVTASLVAVSILAVMSLAAFIGVFALYERAGRRVAEHEALLKDQELHDLQKFEGLRDEVQLGIAKGQALMQSHDWQGARVVLANAQVQIVGEPRLAQRKAEVDSLLADVVQRLAGHEAQAAGRARYQQFNQQRDRALFHVSQLTGLDRSANQEATRQACRAALDLVGRSKAKTLWALDSLLQPHLTRQEFQDLQASCYELWLVFAEAEAQPLQGEAPSAQAAAALHCLSAATSLKTPIRAFYLRQAKYLGQQGDATAAAQARQLAVALPPADATDYFLLGEEAYQANDLALASSCFRSALRTRPDHFWAQYMLGLCSLHNQLPGQAEASLTACKARRPDFVWIPILRGLALGELGSQALATHRPEEAALHFAAAEADYREALQLDPGPEARYTLLVNRGVVRYRQKQLTQAIRDFSDALPLSPRPTSVHVNLAQVFQDQKRLDEAVEQLNLALRLEPKLAGLYRTRARLHLTRRDAAAALKDFEAAIRFELPGSKLQAGDYTERGRILYEKLEFEEAVRSYDLALRIDPEYVDVQRYRGVALMKLKRYQEAARAFDQCVIRGPAIAAVYEARALARTRLKDYAGAAADYSRALDLEPDQGVYRRRRGWCYLYGEAPRLALGDFEEALRLAPQDTDALTGRGYAAVKLGYYQEATADAEQAVKLDPSSSSVHYKAASVLALAVGRLAADPRQAARRLTYEARAIELLAKAIELIPSPERSAFWREFVRADGDLAALARHPGFSQLANRYHAVP